MMNVFDILIIIIVIGLAISGYREGLVRSSVKLAGFIITIIIIAAMSDRIIRLSHMVEFLPPSIAVPLSFIVILIVGIMGFHLLAKILHDLIHMTPVGFIDSGLGCAFGVLKALLVGGIIALALSFAQPETFLGEQFRTSHTAQPLVQLLSESIPFVKRTVKSFYRHMSPPQPNIDKEEYEEILPDNII